MNDIRLVVCDIDGTLLDYSGRLGSVIHSEIAKLNNKGITFTLATGRNHSQAKAVAKALNISAPYVTSNGACVFLGEECIKKYSMPIRPLKKVLGTAAALGFEVTIAGPYALWTYPNSRIGPDMFEEMQLMDLDGFTEETDDFQKVLIFGCGLVEGIDTLMALLQDLPLKYSINHFPGQAIEIGPPGCSKARGVAYVGDMLGVPMKNTMVCGDYVNDREMIRRAGIGVAVGNASDEIKRAADYVAKRNNVYGVIEAINRYCHA